MILNYTRKPLPQIIFLRGIAAIMVCLFHLCCGNQNLFNHYNVLQDIFQFGYLGVPVFFIISGFIICYSLPADYKIVQFKTFIYKRLIRIEPAYFASILLVLLLNFCGSYFNHIPFHFSWRDFLYHFAYLNNFNLGQYYNVVYWTLGIEFQFYLVIGLTFSFINRSANSVITASILIFFTSFIHSARMQLVFQYLPIFGMGIIVYFYLFKKNLSGTSFGLLFLIFLVQIYFQDGLPTLVASLLTVLTLNYWTYNHRLFDFLSNISFSLYLTHTIIGGKIINLGLRFVSYPFQRYLLFLLAFFVSLAFAYLFYIFIEKPFIALGKKVHYKIP